MTLRPMSMADADKMLEWKNYPETRKFAILTNDAIISTQHYEWLESNLNQFKVLEDDNSLVGAIRVYKNEISIWVDRGWRNKRMATFMLGRVARIGMIAKIVNGNIASINTFIRAGFRAVDYKDNYYIFQL